MNHTMDSLVYEVFRFVAMRIVSHGTVADFAFLAATSVQQYKLCTRYIAEENLVRGGAVCTAGYGRRGCTVCGPLNELILSRTCYCGRIDWNVRKWCGCQVLTVYTQGDIQGGTLGALTKRVKSWSLAT